MNHDMIVLLYNEIEKLLTIAMEDSDLVEIIARRAQLDLLRQLHPEVRR